MADMKEAVASAAKFITEMFPKANDIRLEEIVANGTVWNVVLSFVEGEKGLADILYPISNSNRSFKTIEVEKDSGEPRALRVWKA